MIGSNQHLAQISKRLKTSSAVAPSLIFSAIALPFGSAGIAFGPTDFKDFFAVLAGVPVGLTALQIVFFTLFDRDRLQNEEHLEKRMLLSRLSPEMGDANSTITLDQQSRDLKENPSLEGSKNV